MLLVTVAFSKCNPIRAYHGTLVTAARRGTAQLAGAAAQPLEMLPGHRFHHPGKPHHAAAAGDILAHMPGGQRIQVADRVRVVEAIEDAG